MIDNVLEVSCFNKSLHLGMNMTNNSNVLSQIGVRI
jgi:hypothetical protein